MKLIAKYSPKVLRNLDTNLRVNHPWLWATGIHFTLYIGIILISFFSLIGLLIKVDYKDVPSFSFFGQMFALLMIPAIAWLVYLFRQLSLFNIDKLHGKQARYREFFVLIIYFITMALPFCIPISTVVVLDARVRNSITNEDFAKDCLHYNNGIRYFPFQGGNDYKYFESDSAYSNDYFNKNESYSSENDAIKDSIYNQFGVFEKQRPHLYFKTTYNAFNMYSEDNTAKENAFQLFHYKRNMDRDTVIAKEEIRFFSGLIKKYSNTSFINQSVVLKNYRENVYSESFANNILGDGIYLVKSNMESIGYSKDKQRFFHNYTFWLCLFLIVFYSAVLFSIFKQVTGKQFILGLSLLAIIVTLLGIFQAVSTNHTVFFAGMIAIPMIGIIYFITQYRTSHYTVYKVQTSIILNILLPIIGIIGLAFLDQAFDIFHSSYFDKYKYNEVLSDGRVDLRYSSEYYALKTSIWNYTFWIGIFVYMFIWNSFLKKMYIRLWNLPKHN